MALNGMMNRRCPVGGRPPTPLLFEADLQTGELRKNGAKVPLQGQPFQVCAILLSHAGELVSREELRQQVWPEDTFVDFDHALNTAITKIRRPWATTRVAMACLRIRWTAAPGGWCGCDRLVSFDFSKRKSARVSADGI